MLNLSPLPVIQLAKEEYNFTQHMISVSPVRAHLMKFHEGVSSPQTESLLHISPLWDRSVTCIKSEMLAAASCVLSVKCVSRLVRRPDVLRKRWGRGGRSPPPPTHTQKKCGFIASLGQRAGGVSLPHGTIISWALSTERNMAWRQRGRGRAKDRDDGAETQSGNTTR